MYQCSDCPEMFDPVEARREYEAAVEDGNYDLDSVGGRCGPCAIGEAEHLANVGRAVLMMSGGEDYDDDFVQEWL